MKNLKKRLSKEPAWKILLASGAVTIPLALAVTVGTQWLGFGEPEWTDQAVPVEDQISFSEMAALLKASDPTDEVAVFAQKIMFRDASVAEDGEGFIKSAELNPYTTHLFGGDYSDIPAQVTSHNTSTGTLSGLLKAAFYLALLGLIGTQTGLFSFGANGRAMTVVNTRDLKTSLDDVAGLEIVRDELRDMVELIKAGDQVSALGATPPKGVLLQGPPGTGKTMLARALAKDAGVSFMTLDATRLNDRFVGVGPRRIADAFRRARKAAPCIVFIDELDSIGSRDANDGGEGVGAERTNLINAMLQQLDGLSGSEGVFVVAATNRAEAVDPALVRPGRIDRHISIGLPDRQARAEILMYHTRNMPLGGSIDLDRIAQSVPGMSAPSSRPWPMRPQSRRQKRAAAR